MVCSLLRDVPVVNSSGELPQGRTGQMSFKHQGKYTASRLRRSPVESSHLPCNLPHLAQESLHWPRWALVLALYSHLLAGGLRERSSELSTVVRVSNNFKLALNLSDCSVCYMSVVSIIRGAWHSLSKDVPK